MFGWCVVQLWICPPPRPLYFCQERKVILTCGLQIFIHAIIIIYLNNPHFLQELKGNIWREEDISAQELNFCVYGRGRGGPSPPPPPLSSFVSSNLFLARDSPVFFLQSLLCLAAACHFLVLRNFWAFFHTLASHLFLGFLAGHPLKLPSRIHFGILLTNILTTCPAHCNLLTHVWNRSFLFNSV